jgi:hypothetical protein
MRQLAEKRGNIIGGASYSLSGPVDVIAMGS